MSKVFYCAQCGIALEIKIKAFKSDIVRTVAPHTCKDLEEGEGYDFIKTVESDQHVKSADGKFVQKLDDLEPPRTPGWPQDERPQPADLRVDKPTSTAPAGTRDQFNREQTKETPDPRGNEDYEPDSGVGSDE